MIYGTLQVQQAVSVLIGELLDQLKFDEACQLAREYRFYTNDLILVLVRYWLPAAHLLLAQHCHIFSFG